MAKLSAVFVTLAPPMDMDGAQCVDGFAAQQGAFHSRNRLPMSLVVEAAELMEPFQWLTEKA